MQYRPYGKTGWQVSALGFGAMRLPQTSQNEIDAPEAERMIKNAIEQGVNYIDTAYGYHRGESERFVGKILQGGWRERVRLVTKMPVWLVKEAADFERLLSEQLGKLQTDHLDVYLLHALNRNSWGKVRDLGVLDWLEAQKRSGRIGAFGFSFHDSYQAFTEIVDAYPDWDVCQIQYNYMNETEQAGTAGLKYAAERGLGVIIMEPLLGGRLATPPERIRQLWAESPAQRSPAEWALQWLWDKPEVSLVLSGMSSAAQVEENLSSAARSGVGSLSPADHALVSRVQQAYANLVPIPCTACEYCLPCPNGVIIPRNFAIFNDGAMHDNWAAAREDYHWFAQDKGDSALAGSCVQCGECELKCPQNIAISRWMPHVADVLGLDKPYDPTVTF